MATVSSMDSSARVVGTAAIFLRPLRFMFDVETNVEVVSEEGLTGILPFDTVHVHLRAATRPPLMERDELLKGFLRAETQIHSRVVSTHRVSSSSDTIDKYKVDLEESKDDYVDDESENSERMLSALLGTYVWVLVRIQPLHVDKSTTKAFPLDAKSTKETLRVQYQISPPSESFCLPIDHTNVVKLLVTDDLINHVEAKMLQFTFLSVTLSNPETSAAAKEIEGKSTAPINYSDSTLAASEAAVAEEVRRRQQVEAELAEAKSVVQAKDRERLEAQLQAKQDAQRAQDLELARREQAHARSLLEQELASHEQKTQELNKVRKQLEDQLQATNESAQRFQINITSTDQALEMLKQRAVSDAKEREELQRRLRVLEEEKLALQNKSRACTIQ